MLSLGRTLARNDDYGKRMAREELCSISYPRYPIIQKLFKTAQCTQISEFGCSCTRTISKKKITNVLKLIEQLIASFPIVFIQKLHENIASSVGHLKLAGRLHCEPSS